MVEFSKLPNTTKNLTSIIWYLIPNKAYISWHDHPFVKYKKLRDGFEREQNYIKTITNSQNR